MPPPEGAAKPAEPRIKKKRIVKSNFVTASEPATVDRLYDKPPAGYAPPKFCEKFLQAAYSHIASFNTFVDFFLPEIVKDLDPIYVDPLYDRKVHELDPFYSPVEYLKVYVRSIHIGMPTRTSNSGGSQTPQRLLPRACRNGHMTYSAPLWVEFVHDNVAHDRVSSITKCCGSIPVMIRSNRCHLSRMTATQVVLEAGEEANELGGYFVINGNERVIRYVVQQRCNHPIALKKPRFRDRDLFFSDSAVLIRCARPDGTSTANILFYTEDGTCAFRLLVNRQEMVCPFWTLLRALMPALNTTLLKQKVVYETALSGCGAVGNAEEVNASAALLLNELEMAWKDFMEFDVFTTGGSGALLISDIDRYEDRYLHQLGKLFWDSVGARLKPGSRYEDAGRHVINKFVLVHCRSWTAKFECLLLMYRKLLALKRGDIATENIDSFAYQEVVTPGQLFASVLKDALWNTLQKIKLSYTAELRIAALAQEDPLKVVGSKDQFDLILRRVIPEISHSVNYFMSTGNIKTFQLDLQQLSGWTVVADRLNINRFLSHFRAVHRGQFFAQMRTTEVRKLLGETWGFLCPVHTPDGGPCGLLLHLAQGAVVVAEPAPDGKALAAFKLYLARRGIPVDLTGDVLTPPVASMVKTFPLVFDGEPICRLPRGDFQFWIDELRKLKLEQSAGLPQHVEVAAFPAGLGAFEGIFVFSSLGRIVRQVKHLESQKLEWIGPLGQPWMDIACLEEEVVEADRLLSQQKNLFNSTEMTKFKDIVEKYKISDDSTAGGKPHQIVPVKYTHVEVYPTSVVSITSALTPFSNHNQSPRNMYQCQMLKQTMGTPFHSVPYRTDNKAYRLMFPQLPIVRTKEFREYNFDEYPSGTNAILAVIAYTGYDMEDAMILNRGSMERGFAHAVVYKTKLVDAAPQGVRGFEARNYVFSNRTPTGDLICKDLQADGLPTIGLKLTRDVPLYRTVTVDALSTDSTAKTAGHVTTYHDDEPAYVDKVNFIGAPEDSGFGRGSGPQCQRASIKLRCVRNPIVGDKFASRAGQKGILSMTYPTEDMPFAASGMVPDIVFNPHGFPSRMTVGMLIELIAGKAAAVHGSYQDCTPFRTFPRQERCGVPWIDQGALHGWVRRGNKYASPEEDEAQTTDTAIDYFGKALLKAGYQYYGSEPLYSGIHGVEMESHIFMGVIYYQRLRHMVSDKWQVRSTGPIDSLTRQPVKGRKRGGGVRFGEMERDALLAHGTSCLLQDRLMHCSDEHKAFVCPSCGSILSPSLKAMTGRTIGGKKPIASCRVCNVPCRLVSLPYVFRYICNELAAMNVIIRLKLTEGDKPLDVKPNPEKELDAFASLSQINAEGFNLLDDDTLRPINDAALAAAKVEMDVDKILPHQEEQENEEVNQEDQDDEHEYEYEYE